MEDRPFRTVLCDLDGVVWLAHRPIPGAVDGIAAMRAAGLRCIFVTNNSSPRRGEVESALGAIGVHADGDVLTSAMAAAGMVDPTSRVLVCADEGVGEALAERGIDIVEEGPCDTVIVGRSRRFDYDMLATAATAIRNGARFIGTNDDATFPTPEGMLPGAGSIIAAVATAAGRSPELAGKPHAPMVDAARAHLGPDWHAPSTVVVGDRLSTDGAFARALGCRFALVRTGVTSSTEALTAGGDPIWMDAPDLGAVAREFVTLIDR